MLTTIRSQHSSESQVFLMNMSRYQLPNMSPETIEMISSYVNSLPETDVINSNPPDGLLGTFDPETNQFKLANVTTTCRLRLRIEQTVEAKDPLSRLQQLMEITDKLFNFNDNLPKNTSQVHE
jgi:hypothetical protein